MLSMLLLLCMCCLRTRVNERAIQMPISLTRRWWRSSKWKQSKRKRANKREEKKKIYESTKQRQNAEKFVWAKSRSRTIAHANVNVQVNAEECASLRAKNCSQTNAIEDVVTIDDGSRHQFLFLLLLSLLLYFIEFRLCLHQLNMKWHEKKNEWKIMK